MTALKAPLAQRWARVYVGVRLARPQSALQKYERQFQWRGWGGVSTVVT